MDNILKLIGKLTLFTVGVVSLTIGVIGVIAPLIPGTPFLIISSLCFAMLGT